MAVPDKRTFSEGMNSDVDNSLLKNTNYKSATNFRLSKSGNLGILTSSQGNEMVSYTLPSGGNKVVGSFEWEKGSKNYYLVWNSNGDHSIYEYDYQLNVISLVFRNSILDFYEDTVITSIDVVSFKKNNIIYWTDGVGEPKKVIIDAGLRTYDPLKKVYSGAWSAGSYSEGDVVSYDFGADFYGMTFYYIATGSTSNTPYSQYNLNILTPYPKPNDGWKISEAGYIYPEGMEANYITQLPEPPSLPPVVQYQSNQNLGTNKLKGKLWQFKYKYTYGDGQESAWSPMSKVALPQNFVNPLDVGHVEEWRDNTLGLIYPINNNAMIRSLRVAFRSVEDSRISNDFYEYDELFLDSFDNTWTEVYGGKGFRNVFSNRENGIPIDRTDSNQLFYYVPRKSIAQTITGDNRLLHANGTYGYDIDPDIITTNNPEISAYYEDAIITGSNNIAPSTGSAPTVYPNVGSTPPQYYFNLAIDIGDIITLKAGEIIRLSLSGNTFVDEDYSDSPYTPALPPSDGIQKYDWSYNYRVSKTDVDNLTPAAHKQKIAADIASNLKAQYIDSIVGNNDGLFGDSAQDFPIQRNIVTGVANGTQVEIQIESIQVKTNPTGGIGITPHDYWTRTIVEEIVYEHITGGSYNKATYKRGSAVSFGLVYGDSLGRLSTVVTSDSFTKEIDWYNHTVSGALANELNGAVVLNMELRNKAPEWATVCHVVKKLDNSVANFIQLPLSIGNQSIDTTNNFTKYFVGGKVNSTDTDTEADFGGLDTVNIYLNALNGDGPNAYNEIVPNSILSYSFTPGDRLRFISNPIDGVETHPTTYYNDDVEILGYNEDFNFITINRSHLRNDGSPGLLYDLLAVANESSALVSGALFEIYTPDNVGDLKGYYYETGISLPCSNGNHTGTDGNEQDFANSLPAFVELDCGDTYYKTRWYSNSDSTVKDGEYYMVEDYNFYDTSLSRMHNVGRFNIKTQVGSSDASDDRSGLSKERYKPNTIYYSEPYIQGTDVNRLGTIYDVSFKDTDNSFNSVQAIDSKGDRIIIYQEDKVGFAYNSRYVSTSLGNKSSISSGATAPAISDIQYYDSYNGGISLNPESLNRDIWFDMRRGNICRLSASGIDVISLGKVDKYIKDVSDKMLSGVEKDIAIAAYDKRFHEYTLNLKWSEKTIVTPVFNNLEPSLKEYYVTFDADTYMSQFYQGGSINLFNTTTGFYQKNLIMSVVGNLVTIRTFTLLDAEHMFSVDIYKSNIITFNDMMNTWASFFDYIPDFLGSAGMDMISWKEGNLYKHNSETSSFGEFYGVTHDHGLTLTSNLDPSNTKMFKTMSLATNDTFDEMFVSGMPWSTVADGVVTSMNQLSEFISQDLDYNENGIWGGFLRDSNTPNVDYPILEGDKLRGRWLTIALNLDGGLDSQKDVYGATFRNSGSSLLQ